MGFFEFLRSDQIRNLTEALQRILLVLLNGPPRCFSVGAFGCCG
jgi:hypothetical protein